MSEKMTGMSFSALMEHILGEYAAQGTIFGVNALYNARPDRSLSLFGEKMETPFGPAAGPNTQLAQNIVAAYAAGSRFFELKTVQIMDGAELAACISRPCILADDEGYNCEWSTELRVPEAFDEYVRAWFALKLISKAFGFGAPDGFIFNMSVGYDLAGIQSEKVDSFIEGLKNAENTAVWQECAAWAKENAHRLPGVDAEYIAAISPRVCTSITLSTLHGCPPQEIERIAAYLLGEKGLHTFVKCNPTLLGYDYARASVDARGFDYLVFDDHHFKNDLQYTDAVPMLRRLLALAEEKSLSFGVKLTNTFPVQVAAGELPSEEMYMSGRVMFPMCTELARRLTKEFEGKLRISFSGGADIFNLRELYDAGIWPITMATNILKPGGYNRLCQLAYEMEEAAYSEFAGVDLHKVEAIVEKAAADVHYRKPIKPLPSRKMERSVPLTDCFEARCRSGCPIGQDIPAYLRLAGEGNYLEALRVITERNPLPFITGTICSHRCMDKCTRNFYEAPVDIRGVKLECAQNAFRELLYSVEPAMPEGKHVAVVGAGAAGLSAAFFLSRAGCDVTVFEKSPDVGGIVKRVIPGFRIADEAIELDAELCQAYGAAICTGVEIESLDALREQGYTDIVLCLGAWIPGAVKLERGETMNVIAFLEQFKADPAALALGENVVIIGAGNTAMDAARAAKRVPGVKSVSVVYRRTRRYMPADEAELREAMEDGVKFLELLSPVALEDGQLLCRKMTLGVPDEKGRRAPVETEETVSVAADTVIAAVGEKTDSAFYAANGLALDDKGRVIYDAATQESSVKGVYVCGDGAKGPGTVVEAIADAARAAAAICGAKFDRFNAENAAGNYEAACAKKGCLNTDCANCKESLRCLECATVCECCVDVCPNRANVAVPTAGGVQIVHLDAVCNECGNCAVFCPYESAPYKDKWTLFAKAEDMDDSENEGFAILDGAVLVRYDGEKRELPMAELESILPKKLADTVRAVVEAKWLR